MIDISVEVPNLGNIVTLSPVSKQTTGRNMFLYELGLKG